MVLQGDGFATEEGVVPDYWEFNANGLSSVRVYCDNGRQLYRGDRWGSQRKDIGMSGPFAHRWTAPSRHSRYKPLNRPMNWAR